MGEKKIFHVNGKLKGAGVVVLISDKIDFKSKTVIGGKGSYCINDKELIQQEDIIIINVLHLTPEHLNIKQTLTDLNGEISDNTIMVRDFDTLC